jgi:hypothetical protein
VHVNQICVGDKNGSGKETNDQQEGANHTRKQEQAERQS